MNKKILCIDVGAKYLGLGGIEYEDGLINCFYQDVLPLKFNPNNECIDNIDAMTDNLFKIRRYLNDKLNELKFDFIVAEIFEVSERAYYPVETTSANVAVRSVITTSGLPYHLDYCFAGKELFGGSSKAHKEIVFDGVTEYLGIEIISKHVSDALACGIAYLHNEEEFELIRRA